MAKNLLTSSARREIELRNCASIPRAGGGESHAVAARLHQAVRASGGNKAVAARAGIPLATVNNYVRGRNGMKIEPLSALAAVCGISLEWLVSGSDESASRFSAEPDDRLAAVAPSAGLADATAAPSPAGLSGGLDVAILAKAIEIVTAIVAPGEWQDEPKALARRIATTYAVLVQPENARD